MLVSGLNLNKQMITVNTSEVYWTKNRSHKLSVHFERGYTFRGRNGSHSVPDHVYIQIHDAEGHVAASGWNGFPSMDEGKAALRSLSSNGKIYDEEGWDGCVVNGVEVLY